MDKPTGFIVTGGAGFIGAHVVAALLRLQPRPYVLVIDDFRTGSMANIIQACARAGVGPFDGSVIAAPVADIWHTFFAHGMPKAAGPTWLPIRPRAVFHLAAITDTTLDDERAMLAGNLAGWIELMHWCVEWGAALVYASSAAVYGRPPQTHRREPFPLDAAGQPCNVYGFSKWLMECQHRWFLASRGWPKPGPPIVGLRYFNVFGPGESCKGPMASMVTQLTRQLVEGRRPRLFVDGTQARDYIYIDDAVEATLAAAGLGSRPLPDLDPLSGRRRPPRAHEPAPIVPGVYNVGSGSAVSFNELLEAIRSALNITAHDRPTEYFPMPDAIARIYQPYTCADLTATAQGLGWQPRWEPLEAVRRCVRELVAGWTAGQDTPPPRCGN